jgi:hypothetical protein
MTGVEFIQIGVVWDEAAKTALPPSISTTNDMTGGITVKSGSKATLPTAVMAGAGPPSTTTLLATRKVVNGRPAPTMTRIVTVALLADC